MARVKLPREFAARVRSVHHPPPPPPPAAPAKRKAGSPSTSSSSPPTTAPAPTASSSKAPLKAPNPGVAIAVTRGRKWDARVQKHFLYPKHVHVSDPTAAVRAGDTITAAWWPSLSRSPRVTHTVTGIVRAHGGPDAPRRNPVWSEEQRRAWRKEALLRTGTTETQRGLREGALEIGQGGDIVDIAKQAERERLRAAEREGTL